MRKVWCLQPETIFNAHGERWVKLRDPGAVSVIRVNRYLSDDADLPLTFQDVETFFYFEGRLWYKNAINSAVRSDGTWRSFNGNEQVEAFHDRD